MEFLITYDLRKTRNYKPLYDCFAEWKAVRLLESVWLADLKGPAEAIRNILSQRMDADDGLAVIQLKPHFDWATIRCQAGGVNWLKTKCP